MKIDPTITVGNIIEIAVTIGAVVSAYFNLINRIAQLEVKVNLMWSRFYSIVNESKS